jgi:iron-sulfur cluster assembly protein
MSTPRAKLQVMTLTERAAERVKALSADKAAGAALRIGVKTGGCAGMEYTLEWADAPQPFDEVVESHGARVLVDAKAVMFLLGAEMDWRTEKLSAQFVFSNPNQTGACGCGESVKLAPAAGIRPSAPA